MTALSPAARDFLARHHVMTLATVGPDGPWASAVFYCSDVSSLLFLSSPATRHGRNLAQDPRCAATIQDDCADWAQVRGIQLEGRVQALDGDAAAAARRRYGERFSVVGGAGAPAAIVEALARVRWYALQPQRLLFIDNSRGFGHRDEFAGGAPDRPLSLD